MSKIKKRTAFNMAAVILAMSLNACGSNGVENIADTPEDVTSDIPDETISAPETYEDYMQLAADSYAKQDWESALTFYQGAKELNGDSEEVYRGMSDTYLQMDDVIQALAVLDKGIEKLNTEEQGIEEQKVDSLSQRKDYLLANVVAIQTKITESHYDDDGNISYKKVTERDRNGNDIKFTDYRAGEQLSWVTEYAYDAAGNKISSHSTKYERDGSSSESYDWERTYDENGNVTEHVSYDENGKVQRRWTYEYDEDNRQICSAEYRKDGSLKDKMKTEYDNRGNEVKREYYDTDGRITCKILMEYDESGHEIKYVKYDAAGNTVEKAEYEYDENGNAVKYVHYDGVRSVDYSCESEYDENGNEIKHIEYDSEGNIKSIQESEYNDSGAGIACESLRLGDEENERRHWTYEYDKKGRETQYETVISDGEGNVIFHHKRESEYDDYGIRTRYYEITENAEGNNGYSWDRIYDEFEHEFIEMFFLCDEYGDEFYSAATEYDKERSEARYTGWDADGNVLTYIETEYDADGNIIRENLDDKVGGLQRHYEYEYDDFGSITLQAAYEGDILKSKKEVEYTYRYIGDINAEASNYADVDMTVEEQNGKQRDIFMQFLEGKEKICYYSDTDYVGDGRIVSDTITDLIDFKYADDPCYAFIDMTGDEIEELVICGGYKLYVIQCDYGTLKVIQEAAGGTLGAHLVTYGEKIGICCVSSGVEYYRRDYYFLGENFLNKKGQKFIALEEQQDYNEDGEEIKTYCARDNISFDYRDINEGEYYDIADKIIWMPDSYIEWHRLEAYYD